MADTASLERIESFPYRHRVHEVMGSPVATVKPEAAIVEACARMAEQGISSLVVADPRGRPVGIVTERDILRAVARHREDALARPVEQVMSSPVATVRDDALLYVAMGRMDRLNLRHLVAVDRSGAATGMVTVRGLLHLRAGTALALGDEVVTALDAAGLGQARRKIPALARTLLAEGLGGLGIAAVASSVQRDMTARAAELAESAMRDAGWGAPPGAYCVLLLGSGGRRDSLFDAPQENAIVYDAPKAQDAWFAELGRRMNHSLAEAGLAPPPDGTLAAEAAWRRDVAGWRAALADWARDPGAAGPALAAFCDFRPVFGSVDLAEALRGELAAAASESPALQRAAAGPAPGSALGVLGQFKTRDGRIEVAAAGLAPLAGAARALALTHGVRLTGTAERLRALAADGRLGAADSDALVDAYDLMLRLVLRQQIADLAAGRPAGGRVEPALVRPEERDALKAAFKAAAAFGAAQRG